MPEEIVGRGEHTVKYCMHCGAQLREGDKFCRSCGEPVTTQPQVEHTQVMNAVPAAPNTPQTPPAAPLPPTNGAPNAGMPPYAAPTAPAVSASAAKSRRTLIAVIAALVVVALIVVGVVLVVRAQQGTGQVQSAAEPSATSSEQSDDASKSTKSSKKFSFNTAKLDSIVHSAQPSAVALSTTDSTADYSSSNASTRYVAAGLYWPVYLAYTDNGKHNSDSAGQMIRTMDNSIANQLIDSLGGTSKLNDWLKKNGYANTEFQRHFGDVEASNAGQENYSSAQDSVKMLNKASELGESNVMNFDVTSEGVQIPSGMSVHAHRGQGVGNAYNYFVVAKDSGKTFSIVLYTQNQGEDAAADLLTNVLDEVHDEAVAYASQSSDSLESSESSDSSSSSKQSASTTKPVTLSKSYVTQFEDVAQVTFPKYQFDYPSNWSVSSNPTQTSETVTLRNANGKTIEYSFEASAHNKAMGPRWKATITKMADAQFKSTWVQANPPEDLGQFIVAKVVNESSGATYYALLPDHLEDGNPTVGTHRTMYGPAENSALDFNFSGTWHFMADVGSFSQQEVNEIVAILASLRPIE